MRSILCMQFAVYSPLFIYSSAQYLQHPYKHFVCSCMFYYWKISDLCCCTVHYSASIHTYSAAHMRSYICICARPHATQAICLMLLHTGASRAPFVSRICLFQAHFNYSSSECVTSLVECVRASVCWVKLPGLYVREVLVHHCLGGQRRPVAHAKWPGWKNTLGYTHTA